MKIPQRQDQVSLEAPRTAAGNVPEPTTAGLGNSYIQTMQSMSKSLQDLSDLQYKLSMNATEMQLDKFNLYATQRTKQYEEELKFATSQEQINNLFVNYKKDLDENGVNTLGQDLYSGWYSREGGKKVATAEYTGSLASAQLQISLNKQALEDEGRDYNRLAFASKDPEERKKYINEWEEMLGRYVSNGTISEAEKQNIQRDWNLNFVRSIVRQDMDLNPKETAEKLRKDKDYAIILTSEERLRTAQEAEALYYRRKGTQNDSNVKLLKEVWLAYYKSGNEAGYNAALNTYKKSVENNKEGMKAFETLFKNAGVSGFENISTLDLEEFSRWADTSIKNPDQEKVSQFWEKRTELDEGINKILSYGDNGKDKVDIYTLGKFKYKENDPSSIVDAYRQNVAQKNNIQMQSIINNTSSVRNKINEQQTLFLNIYVKGLDGSYKGTKQWEENMYTFLKPYYKAIKDDTQGDADIQMTRVIEYLWNNYDPKEMFSDTSKITQDIMGNALAQASLPFQDNVYKVFAKDFLNKKNDEAKNNNDFSSGMIKGHWYGN